jgi:hypothetical protein
MLFRMLFPDAVLFVGFAPVTRTTTLTTTTGA